MAAIGWMGMKSKNPSEFSQEVLQNISLEPETLISTEPTETYAKDCRAVPRRAGRVNSLFEKPKHLFFVSSVDAARPGFLGKGITPANRKSEMCR